MSSFLSDIIASAGGDIRGEMRKRIEYLPITQIYGDERNFYSMTEIQELADNIKLVGLLDPIVVREDADRQGVYFIISGHRRRAALWLLYEEDPEEYAMIMCIVERAGVSPAMEELQLIFANSATRKLSDSDIAKQTERVTELLYQLQAEGVEFPGSMRKHVAEACQISETKVATLKVINENLHEHFKAQFSAGELPTNTAYNIARLPALVQEDLAKAMPKSKVSGNASDNLLKHYEKYYDLSRLCPDGDQICDNAKGMLSKTAHGTMSWDYCGSGCCMKCSNKLECGYACRKAKELQKEAKEEKKAQDERAEAQLKAAFELHRRETTESAKRIVAMADAAGVGDDACVGVGCRWGVTELSEIRRWAAGDFGDTAVYDNLADFRDVDRLITAAKMFNCSTDALLGLAEPGEKPVAADCEWQTGKPTVEGLYIGRFYTDGMGKPMLKPTIWRDGCWNFHNISASIDMECVGWHKIPEV